MNKSENEREIVKKGEQKEGKCPNIYSYKYEGRTYRVKGEGTYQEFVDWFNEYAPEAPRCASCGLLIFPYENVGRIKDDDLVHLTHGCCDSGSFYAGFISSDGALFPAFEGGITAAEHTMRTGKTLAMNFPSRKENIEIEKRHREKFKERK